MPGFDLRSNGDPNASNTLVTPGGDTNASFGWNSAWNEGYNNSALTINPYAGQSVAGYDYGQGFTLGQQQYLKDHPAGATNPSPTGTSGTGGTVLGTSAVGTSGPSGEDQLKSELDNIFSPVFSALSGQETTLGQNYGITNQDINANYNTSAQNLAKQNTQGQAQLNQLGTEAGKTKSDAWTQATRLYNELTRGGQQRYGGASSAGEAFNTLTSVEQQRRQSTIQSSYDDAMQKVASYKANLESQFEQTTAQLEQDRDSALRDAQKEFNNAWQQIQSNKSQAQSDKSTATLNTLNDYRNKVYTINMQAVQFAQALAANKQTSLASVDKYTQQVMNNLASGNQTYQSLSGTLGNVANSTGYGKTGVGMASNSSGVTGATTGSYYTWDSTSGTYKKVNQ